MHFLELNMLQNFIQITGYLDLVFQVLVNNFKVNTVSKQSLFIILYIILVLNTNFKLRNCKNSLSKLKYTILTVTLAFSFSCL